MGPQELTLGKYVGGYEKKSHDKQLILVPHLQIIVFGFDQGLVTEQRDFTQQLSLGGSRQWKFSYLLACKLPIFFNIQLSFNKTKQNLQQLIFDIAAILFLDSIQQVLAEAARNLISN